MRRSVITTTMLAAVAALTSAPVAHAVHAAPTTERGDGPAPTRVTVEPYGDFTVRGRVDSRRPACEQRRRVVVSGVDLADDTVRTTRNGTYRFDDVLAAVGARIVVRAPATRTCAAGVGRYRVPLPSV